MIGWIKEFYWNLPEWGRWLIILWFTMTSFKLYLKNLYNKKDFISASFYIILFILLIYSMLNHFGSDFNLISGGY